MSLTKKNLYKEIPYFRAFKIKYFGATNTKGSRIKIIDIHRSEKQEVFKFISWDYSKNNGWEIATEYLNKIGIKVLYRCASGKEDFLLTDSFETDLK
jgi:hypothetical protein